MANEFQGAVHDEVHADLGPNDTNKRVVRIDVDYTRGTGAVETRMVLSLDAAITLRNRLDALLVAAGIDGGASAADQDLPAAATATLRLWNKYGLGDDDAESEPVHQALVNAIAQAKHLI